MKAARDLPLPFPPDQQQIELLRSIAAQGNYAIASEGTNRFEAFCHLVEAGLMESTFCKRAGKVYQFRVNDRGQEVLA